MSAVIRQETVIFALAVLHGAGLTVLYDVLRALRRAFVHGLAAVSAEDFLYWLTAGFLTFAFAFLRTDGVIRGYVAVGMALGAILYHFTLSSLFVGGLAWILRMIKKLSAALGRLLSKPVKNICKKCKKLVEFIRKTRYNRKSDEGAKFCRRDRTTASAGSIERMERNIEGKHGARQFRGVKKNDRKKKEAKPE